MPKVYGSGFKEKLDVIKLKDGEPVYGVGLGKPYLYASKYNGKFYENVTWDGNTRLPEGYKFRFRLSFAVKNGKNWTVRVLEGGKMLFNSLNEVNEESPIDENMVKIIRKGSGQNDTEYWAQVAGRDNKLTKEDAALLAQLKPLDLRIDDEKDEEKFNSI